MVKNYYHRDVERLNKCMTAIPYCEAMCRCVLKCETIYQRIPSTKSLLQSSNIYFVLKITHFVQKSPYSDKK